jgi:glycosyltransferase involved in cell wall biosynthesis
MPGNIAPLISIALCTFNGERHLREQLDSVLAQDWPHLEIIAIDDASTDGTPAILATYAKQDTRIRYSRNERNLGYHLNFETAITRCQGRWIAPCDQDDIWLPHKLSTLAGELGAGRSVLAYGDSELMDEHGHALHQRLSDRMRRFSTDDPVPFWFANNVTGHAMLFERDLLAHALPFPTHLFHDWWLAYVAASTGRISYVDQCLVRYRQHARTMTDITGSRPDTAERTRGFRRRELADTRTRLERFAQVPGKGQALTLELLSLWRARESQFVSCRLAWFFWKYRQRIHAISKDSASRKARRAFQYIWGLRTKQLLEPHRYAHTL